MDTSRLQIVIPDRQFFRIGDVAELLGVRPHVLRYWETEFTIISPDKSRAGHRVYGRMDVENLVLIRHLLYVDRYSIEGARLRIKELRKSGELKSAREAVLPQVSESQESRAAPELQAATAGDPPAVLGLVRELHGLSRVSIDELFGA